MANDRLARPSGPVRATRPPDRVRADLIAGLAEAVAEKGYAACTIADVVARARVSKRTFYEHFADKEDCLLALYADSCDRLLEVLRGTGGPGQPWRDRVVAVVSAYLTALDEMPAVSRAVLVEMQAAGPRAYRLRQRTQRRFADALVELVATARRADPELAELPPDMALALVGGINELLLEAVDPYAGGAPGPGAGSVFAALHGTVVRLVAAVLSYRG
ncbi:TetR/AcrR family transcriptional regulator [Plantactinospora siamensis]|uniref:TetR/AcrR family transcriptional regulator n=1 Tax=Plantactinospora siamensis TaxID=555372 RepID=A0ABV6P496_9ACTN